MVKKIKADTATTIPTTNAVCKLNNPINGLELTVIGNTKRRFCISGEERGVDPVPRVAT